MIRVGRNDGKTQAADAGITIDYSAFRIRGLGSAPATGGTARGGPHHPGLPGCRAAALPINDLARAYQCRRACWSCSPRHAGHRRPGSQRLGDAATDATTGTLIALSAGPSSGETMRVTSLQPSSTWSATGTNAGGVYLGVSDADSASHWRGTGLQVTLSYTSQSVDGRMAAQTTSPHGSVTDWEFAPGYIEYGTSRATRTWRHGTTARRPETCAGSPTNATLSLNVFRRRTSSKTHTSADYAVETAQ